MNKLLLSITAVLFSAYMTLLCGCATIDPELAAENKRVSDLDEITTSASGTEELFVNQSGSSRKITVDNLLGRLESEISGYAIAQPNLPDKIVGIVVVDDDTSVAVEDGAGDVLFRVPAFMDQWNLVDVEACHYVAGAGTGTQYTAINIYNTGTTQLADMITKGGGYSTLRIDEDELDSKDAVTQPTIDTGNDDVRTGDQLRIDVELIPTTTAPKGLYVELHFRKP